MNLQQIDERLSLFPEYLAEKLFHQSVNLRLDLSCLKAITMTPMDIMRTFQDSGYLMVSSEQTEPDKTFISFDDWLWLKQRYDLCDLEEVTCLQDVPEVSGPVFWGEAKGSFENIWAKSDKWFERSYVDAINPVSRLNKLFTPSYPQTILDVYGFPKSYK